MSLASVSHPENETTLTGLQYPNPEQTKPLESIATATPTVEHQGSSTTFEEFLAGLELCVPEAGQLLLFTGDHLRLEVKLLRQEAGSHVAWGVKQHEDWAFKATLLRLARDVEPVHLILSTENDGKYRIRGWVVKRSMDSFWARPLPLEMADRFWERCLKPYSA
jgi:hypothetical protein